MSSTVSCGPGHPLDLAIFSRRGEREGPRFSGEAATAEKHAWLRLTLVPLVACRNTVALVASARTRVTTVGGVASEELLTGDRITHQVGYWPRATKFPLAMGT